MGGALLLLLIIFAGLCCYLWLSREPSKKKDVHKERAAEVTTEQANRKGRQPVPAASHAHSETQDSHSKYLPAYESISVASKYSATASDGQQRRSSPKVGLILFLAGLSAHAQASAYFSSDAILE